MRVVFQRIDELAYEFALHPLFAWILDDDTPAEERLAFAPSQLLVVMASRALLEEHFCYEQADDPIKQAIGAYVAERASQPSDFLADWQALGMEEAFALSPSEMLHWVHLAKCNQMHRRHELILAELALVHSEPEQRYVMMELLAACDHVFASVTAHVAPPGLKYFGAQRARVESGFVGETARLFAGRRAAETDPEGALTLVERVARIIWERADVLLEFAQAHSGVSLTAMADCERDTIDLLGEEAELIVRSGEVSAQLPVQVELEHALIELPPRDHRLFALLHTFEARYGDLMLETLASSIWMSELAQRELMLQVASQCNPLSVVGQALAEVAHVLAYQSEAFYEEYASFRADRASLWRGSELLAQLTSGSASKASRAWLAEITKVLHAQRDPVHRHWVLMAIVESQAPLLAAMARLGPADTSQPSYLPALRASQRILSSQPLAARNNAEVLAAMRRIREAAEARYDALRERVQARVSEATSAGPGLTLLVAAK